MKYMSAWLWIAGYAQDYPAVGRAISEYSRATGGFTSMPWTESDGTGTSIRRKRYSLAGVQAVVEDARAVDLTVARANVDAGFQSYSLRPSPNVPESYQIRRCTIHAPAEEGALARAVTLMTKLCTLIPIAQGYLAAFDRADESGCEQQCGAFTPQDLPDETRARLHEDAMLRGSMATKLRRLYPATILGPALFPIADLIADSPHRDAVTIEDFGACKLLTVSPELVGPRDPEFLIKTRTLRELLWPHTIQNPADRPGLEPDEPSGLPIPP